MSDHRILGARLLAAWGRPTRHKLPEWVYVPTETLKIIENIERRKAAQ